VLQTIKRWLGLEDEVSELESVADEVLGTTVPPSTAANRLGIKWTEDLTKQWKRKFGKCAGCNVWVRGKNTLWCESCIRKG
jgi:hypothetical protein